MKDFLEHYHFIPFERTQYVDSAEALGTQITQHMQSIVVNLAQVMQERQRVGQYLYRGQDGEVWLTGNAPGESSPHLPNQSILIDGWGTVRLNQAQARRCQDVIRELLESFETSDAADAAEEYLYTLILAPATIVP
ncbi:hypothetical protein DVJ83_17230 (plasmid) [Deinococcus wulumuqiensis]|uniref:Uncharacterized protein n=1 Tax=Deinococcus wulumuqiensis TaxID=980427 RepID=A0A345IME0_9DEIO|nr:hypothetical protein [Deinococcus wulumuqiensis]AXH00863.1 hypothetical protein DVJ83_17230 [Deinococcus wulumuqiensis]